MENSFVYKKRIVTLAVLLLTGGFAFAQQGKVRVVGVIPPCDTGKFYDVQVGAFRVAANADRAAEGIRRAGYAPCYEYYGNLTRVIVRGLRAGEIRSCIEQLGCAGFREVVIREWDFIPAERTPDPQGVPDDPAGGIPSAGTDETSAGESFTNEVFIDEEPEAPDPADSSYVPAEEYGDLPHSLPHLPDPFATGSVPSGL